MIGDHKGRFNDKTASDSNRYHFVALPLAG